MRRRKNQKQERKRPVFMGINILLKNFRAFRERDCETGFFARWTVFWSDGPYFLQMDRILGKVDRISEKWSVFPGFVDRK